MNAPLRCGRCGPGDSSVADSIKVNAAAVPASSVPAAVLAPGALPAADCCAAPAAATPPPPEHAPAALAVHNVQWPGPAQWWDGVAGTDPA